MVHFFLLFFSLELNEKFALFRKKRHVFNYFVCGKMNLAFKCHYKNFSTFFFKSILSVVVYCIVTQQLEHAQNIPSHCMSSEHMSPAAVLMNHLTAGKKAHTIDRFEKETVIQKSAHLLHCQILGKVILLKKLESRNGIEYKYSVFSQ